MGEREQIMIIDDDLSHLDIAEEMIGEYFNVTLVVSGIQAIDILASGAPPDLILLDIDMPHLDGYQTYNKIREIQSLEHTPVIFLTGMTGSEAELTGLKLGAQDYITKPFAQENLIARVRLRLNEAQRLREMSEKLKHIGINEQKFDELANLLTASERETARLIALGCSNQEVAKQLNYTIGYVKNIATIVYDKLGINGRQQLRAMFRK